MRKVNNLSDKYSGMSLSKEMEKRNAILGNNGLINFGGSTSFDEEDKTNQVYTVSLTNSGTTSKRIVIFPGQAASLEEIKNVAGFVADAIAKNGTVIEDGEKNPVVTCIAQNLEYFQRFLCTNPTRVVEMQISVSDKKQLAQLITISKLSPYCTLGATSFTPNQYRKASDNDTLMAQVNITTLQFDDQSVFDVVVAPGCSIDITMYMGASRNDAYTLSEQAKIAFGE